LAANRRKFTKETLIYFTDLEFGEFGIKMLELANTAIA
jgi:hypothetical protein